MQPNFIVILGEGAGWTSSSVQMDDRNPASKGTGLRTPNLERLASSGMRFADGYAASPRCTPSRAALFTGKSPAQLHMTFVNEGGRMSDANGRVITPNASTELSMAEITIGEFLQRAGYATAHFGKWHVGRASPSQHGFDESDGATGNGGPDNVAAPNPLPVDGWGPEPPLGGGVVGLAAEDGGVDGGVGDELAKRPFFTGSRLGPPRLMACRRWSI